MGQLSAGAAKVEITPPVGIELAGYGRRTEGSPRSTGVHDPLWVRAVALSDGEHAALIVVFDLLGIELPTTQLIKSLIRRKLPVCESQILVCCTHTHSAPSILRRHETAIAVDEEWKSSAVQAAVRVAILAYDRLQPASLGVGSTHIVGVGANRKVYLDDGSIFHYIGLSARQLPAGRSVVQEGIVDPELSVLCARDSRGQIIAALVNYACHPWLYDGNFISSELSGACVEQVEAALLADHPGTVALFAPGTGSDIMTVPHQYPLPPGRGDRQRWFTAERTRLGGRLAEGALRALHAVRHYHDTGAFGGDIHPLAAPCYDRPLRTLLAEQGHLPPPDHVLHTQLQSLRLGDIAVIGLPSEVYVEYGLEIKAQSRYAHTLVLSYCNDYFADIVTQQAVDEGVCPELEWTQVHPDVRHAILACLREGQLLRPAST